VTGKYDCGREQGLCVKGDMERCPAIDDDDDEGGDECWPEECGMQANGHCALSGTEWCDWSCPIADEAAHNRALKKRAERPFPLFQTSQGD
jgi:hypothetical protein